MIELTIILIVIFVISISTIAENYSNYEYIRETYSLLRRGNFRVTTINNTYIVEEIQTKIRVILHKSSFLYNIQLYKTGFLGNNWTTYFDPYSLIYLILITIKFNKINK